MEYQDYQEEWQAILEEKEYENQKKLNERLKMGYVTWNCDCGIITAGYYCHNCNRPKPGLFSNYSSKKTEPTYSNKYDEYMEEIELLEKYREKKSSKWEQTKDVLNWPLRWF